MEFNLLSELLTNKPSKSDDIEMRKLSAIVADENYLNFLKATNGGSILNSALNFYGVLPNGLELEIFYSNFLFNKYFEDLFPGVFVFGEDIFGNQFAFLKNNKIAFLNIECASIENTFRDFSHFMDELSNNVDYYSGFSIAEKWEAQTGVSLLPSQRLSPIKPFVIGGDYDVQNLRLVEKEQLFDYTAFIARQIKDIPDGANITLKSR